ncbi:MAG: PAS domain-containing protein [Gammaproteobacteria bacterium]|nr:PAS domain-containing protein [Gammaproteobacteria bacterium]
MGYREVIEIIFSLGLFINAVSFIPQIIRIIREKSAKGVSLITFSIFLASQFSAVLYGLIIKSNILVFGYLFSMLTCAPVVLLILFFRRNKHALSEMETNLKDISFKDILDQLPVHVYWKDLRGSILGASYLQCKNLGYTRSSILGANDFDFFSVEQAEKITAVDQEILSTGVPIICEEISNEIDGTERLYISHKIALRNKKDKIVALLGVSIDITNARKKDVERKNILETIIALMPGHVYWTDRNGVYQGCNDIQARSAGLASRMDIVGKRNQNLPWNMNTAVSQIIDQSNEEIMSSGQSKVLEEPVSHTNGEQGYCLSSKVPLRNAEGEVIGLLGISIDITEKKKAEQELLKAKKQAEAANRAKTEFLANMSHDVKTPLSGVIGMAELMMHDFTGSDRQRAEAIYACGMQLLAFFNSCLDLSKLEMMEWASTEAVFSLGKLLHEIGALFSPSAQMKGLEFVVEADSALPAAVRGHHASVYRVMLNLVGNALKFTQHGSVKIRAFLSETLSSNQACVGLEVKDTGIGIPVEQHEVIFEKLRRLTPAYEGKIEGSGIGLYIVDQYVKRMGGKIQVESSEGKGSTFTVFLPMMIASEDDLHAQEDVDGFSLSYIESPIAAPSKAPLTLGKNYPLAENAPRILLVEDNPLIQNVTQALLNGLGFIVDVAGAGAEAIEKFSPGKYALIYMDIGLPDQDGYSVTQVIREKETRVNASAVPIIALTAHGAVDVEAFCGRAGMQGVLSKPLTREQAAAVWERFGLGKSERVAGLTLIGHAEATPQTGQIIDMDGTISLLGTKEYAEELLVLWFEMLTQRFLPALKDFVEKRDDEALRQELHNMLGSLCYVKAPLLNQAVLELQTAARNHPQSIESAYQHVLQEAQRFIKHYSAMTLTK